MQDIEVATLVSVVAAGRPVIAAADPHGYTARLGDDLLVGSTV
jgi:hypothetical protein